MPEKKPRCADEHEVAGEIVRCQKPSGHYGLCRQKTGRRNSFWMRQEEQQRGGLEVRMEIR